MAEQTEPTAEQQMRAAAMHAASIFCATPSERGVYTSASHVVRTAAEFYKFIKGDS